MRTIKDEVIQRLSIIEYLLEEGDRYTALNMAKEVVVLLEANEILR